jgi:hypothetical protein
MEFNTLKEFKAFNKAAHDTLIQMWEQMSRCSYETARRDIRDNLGYPAIFCRYSLKVEDGKIKFYDSETRDTCIFDEVKNDWNMI